VKIETMLHTHYDNLKVARQAPQEVIRAAYKALSQKYHPDKNPGNAKAARVMALLNSAYGTLADPQRRREHDEWIAAEEWDIAWQARHQEHGSARPPEEGRAPPATVVGRSGRGWLLLSGGIGACLGVCIGLYIGMGWPDAGGAHPALHQVRDGGNHGETAAGVCRSGCIRPAVQR
jgi:hypothetical protein